MKKETLDKLCCPFDKSDLELTSISTDISGKIIEGFLLCKQCDRMYPIVKGIPIMSPDEYREFSLEQPLIERWQSRLQGKRFDNFRLVAEPGEEEPDRLE